MCKEAKKQGVTESRYVMVYFDYCNQYDIISVSMQTAKNYRKGCLICVEYSEEEGGWATGRILQIGTKAQVENSVKVNLVCEATRLRHLVGKKRESAALLDV